MDNLYIGLISGTSADGIDAVLVNFHDTHLQLIDSFYQNFSPELRNKILSLSNPGQDEINKLGELDILLGDAFANAANVLLQKNQLEKNKIRAVGSHGQTIRHHPERRFTLQIGDPNIIAARTGITTIADFRRRDIALGGQGAPLVPAFHETIFRTQKKNRVIVNIGGVANITLLPANKTQKIVGYDTGPGNNLSDAWITLHLQQPYDKEGAYAASGTIDHALLETLLKDPYFQKNSPKSTGPEYFNLKWLQNYLTQNIVPQHVQATLIELTASAISNEIKKYFTESEILVCGGGAHNKYLMQRLTFLTNSPVHSTQIYGVDPDLVEAIAFAWLAKQTLEKKPIDMTLITGAKEATILGGIYNA